MLPVRLLIYVLILLLPLGQFGLLPLGAETVNVYINEILIALIGFLFILLTFSSGKNFSLPKDGIWLILFLFVAVVSLVNGLRFLDTRSFIVSSLYLVRFSLYVLLFLTIFNLALRGLRKNSSMFVSRVLKLLIISAVVLSALGFIQLQILPDFTQLDPDLGWDPHQNRLTSTFFDPNFLGAYLVLNLGLVVSLFELKVEGFSKLLLAVAASILFVALILTFSRSAYLMFAGMVFILGVLRSRRLLILSLATFLVAAIAIPRVQTRIAGGVDPDDSASLRFINWQNTWTIIRQNKWFGVGFNAFRYAQERFGFFDFNAPLGGRSGAGSDSSLLFVFATTGMFGLLTYAIFLYQLIIKSLKNVLQRNEGLFGAVSLTVVSVVPALLVESNFINSLFYPWIMAWFFIVAGLFFALQENHE